jgi:hypothetical protein
MRELYIEGLAIHGGPESRVGVRTNATSPSTITSFSRRAMALLGPLHGLLGDS